METLGVLIITLLFIGLFASLCTWHCSIVEELEINGDKENLIETIKIILVAILYAFPYHYSLQHFLG